MLKLGTMNKPRVGGDVYARCSKGSTAGRGAISGWTPCPVCCSASPSSTHILTDESIRALISSIPNTTKSLKLFSHGRGLAAHLHAVHTPWKPGKAEVKRHKAFQKRQENEKRRLELTCKNNEDGIDDDQMKRCSKRQKLTHDDSTTTTLQRWHPTDEEMKRWNEQVVKIVALAEAEANKKKANNLGGIINTKTSNTSMQGYDRNGKEHQSYRDSLPAFLAAASDGDLNTLTQLITNKTGDEKQHIRRLLSLEDRNGSTAEHWAAGGGHMNCIEYLWKLSDRIREDDVAHTNNNNNISSSRDTQTRRGHKKVCRRRDGKTALHYAARNGRNEMIDLILSHKDAPFVDVRSGDGTTPLHMACYGGYVSTVKHLVQKHNSDPFAMNDWNCGAAHFVAMSLGNEGTDALIALCEYLKNECGVDFTSRQKQGHTPLHKAASRKNRHVIEWLADERKSTKQDIEALGGQDDGGNSPSQIWLSVGGDNAFCQWMKEVCSGW